MACSLNMEECLKYCIQLSPSEVRIAILVYQTSVSCLSSQPYIQSYMSVQVYVQNRSKEFSPRGHHLRLKKCSCSCRYQDPRPATEECRHLLSHCEYTPPALTNNLNDSIPPSPIVVYSACPNNELGNL